MELAGMVRRIVAVFACAAISAVSGGCGSSPAAPSTNVSFSQTDLRLGTGAEAASTKVLTVNYTGWLYDATKTDLKGLQFDSNVGGTPFRFTLGIGQVIAGWDQGVPGMKVGGVRRLVVPSSLAYGAFRSGPIPAYASLVFEIELLDVQ